MYQPAPTFSSSPSTIYPDNNFTDIRMYGIEQSDCCLDLNCIEPSLLPGTQQTFTFTTPYDDTTTNTTTGSKNSVADNTNQTANRNSRRTIRKKRPKRDPNEPQKPVSAYALFFRDTQAAIKGRSPNASFGEVSKIVASMWDSLDCTAKNMYKQRTETAKKDYLKKLAVYRAQQISQNEPFEHLSENGAPATTIYATSSSLERQRSHKVHEMREMTLASLIARPPIDKVVFIAGPTSVFESKNR